MNQNLKFRLLVVAGVLATALFFTFPLDKHINLGLDLKGGMHLILRVETETLDMNARQDAVQRAIEILRNRIDGMGVAEPVIQRQGENQIIVQLPGITDRDAALRMIGRVAQLEFYLVSDNPTLLSQALSGNVPEGYLLKTTKGKEAPVLIKDKPALKGESIADARVDVDSVGFGEPKISLSFNAKGAKAFADITRQHVNERLAIVLDGEVLSAPNINEPILTGSAEITGQFSFDDASLLALALRSGSLPAPMHVEEERTIGPLLGKDSIESGVKATIIGAIAVFAFMLIYYLVAGFVADLALLLNLLMILGSMGLLNYLMPDSQVTLTLPGIAGIILTLGMAVDANILINERIREEVANGRPLGAAISNGFNKAFKAIVDSNTTTLFAAFFLFQFGSGPIKGFAVTLTIGLLCSLFTSVFVTRSLLLVLTESGLVKSLPMLRFFGETKIDFVGKRYFCFVLSAAVIIAGLVGLYQKKESAYGIDFAGGQIQEYQFTHPVNADELRGHLRSAGISDIVIQTFREHPENVILRSSEDIYTQVTEAFKKEMPDNAFEVLRIEKVGPIVGKELRKRAVLAMALALAAILIYVGFRFKHFDFAAAGVVALLHDVVVGLGLVVLLGRQVDLLVVTGLMTIAGYSINDTIIIYDRVRENMGRNRKMPLRDLLNLSINQTLSRTILTTLVTLLVVVALYVLGGEVLNTFALTIMIGFVAGTYSTVFIATPLVIAWQKRTK